MKCYNVSIKLPVCVNIIVQASSRHAAKGIALKKIDDLLLNNTALTPEITGTIRPVDVIEVLDHEQES